MTMPARSRTDCMAESRRPRHRHEIGVRLVEHNQKGFHRGRAVSNTLSLACGQCGTCLTDACVVSIGKMHDHVVDARLPGSLRTSSICLRLEPRYSRRSFRRTVARLAEDSRCGGRAAPSPLVERRAVEADRPAATAQTPLSLVRVDLPMYRRPKAIACRERKGDVAYDQLSVARRRHGNGFQIEGPRRRR